MILKFCLVSDRLVFPAPFLYNPLGGAYYRSFTNVALFSLGIMEQPFWSSLYLALKLTA